MQKRGRRRKRPAKIVDDNAPKKPANAYALFIHERFSGVERPKGSHQEAALFMAKAWKELNETDRQV